MLRVSLFLHPSPSPCPTVHSLPHYLHLCLPPTYLFLPSSPAFVFPSLLTILPRVSLPPLALNYCTQCEHATKRSRVSVRMHLQVGVHARGYEYARGGMCVHVDALRLAGVDKSVCMCVLVCRRRARVDAHNSRAIDAHRAGVRSSNLRVPRNVGGRGATHQDRRPRPASPRSYRAAHPMMCVGVRVDGWMRDGGVLGLPSDCVCAALVPSGEER